jgi:hypothetical protein
VWRFASNHPSLIAARQKPVSWKGRFLIMIAKHFLRLFLAAGFTLVTSGLTAAPPATEPAMTVYKTRTCGCCGKWVDHLRANGFTVNVKEVEATDEIRRQMGVPDKLVSCHTGVIAGYAVEGHVPAAEVKRLLKEKPKAKGLAVPAMPIGSPGMEQGSRVDTYWVLLFDEKGGYTEYQKYPLR